MQPANVVHTLDRNTPAHPLCVLSTGAQQLRRNTGGPETQTPQH